MSTSAHDDTGRQPDSTHQITINIDVRDRTGDPDEPTHALPEAAPPPRTFTRKYSGGDPGDSRGHGLLEWFENAIGILLVVLALIGIVYLITRIDWDNDSGKKAATAPPATTVASILAAEHFVLNRHKICRIEHTDGDREYHIWFNRGRSCGDMIDTTFLSGYVHVNRSRDNKVPTATFTFNNTALDDMQSMTIKKLPIGPQLHQDLHLVTVRLPMGYVIPSFGN